MNKALVTIGIPAYKSTFLKQAVESALKQTYENIEVLVIDDQSPHSLKMIVDSIQDNRLHYYLNEKNLGSSDPAFNWNKCLSLAKGDFFVLLCDDDLLEPNFVESMLQLAEDYPLTNVFRSRVKIVNKLGEIITLYPSSPHWETSEDYMWHVFNGYRRQTITEFFYRTDYLKAQGGYLNFPQAWCSDYISIFKFAQIGGIVSSNLALVSFRLSGENISSQLEKNILGKLEANKKAYLYTKKMIYQSSIKWRNILLKDIEVWKRRLDRNTLCYSKLSNSIKLLSMRDQFGFTIMTYIKAKLFYYLIVRKHQ